MNHRLALAALSLSAILLSGCAGPATAIPSAGAPATTSPGPIATDTPVPTPEPSAAASPSGSACVPPATVADLAGLPGMPIIDHLLACFGRSDIVITGYLGPPEGIGGIGNGITPTWLGEWSGLEVVLSLKPFSIDGCQGEDSCPWMFLFAPDPALLPLKPERWVSVTGHFDDPASSTCRATPGSDQEDGPTTDAAAIAICRGHFVITNIRTVPPPS